MLVRVPIMAQLLALVSLGILATAAAMMAITFAGPPPRQPPIRVDEVVRALRGNQGALARFTIGETANPAAVAGDMAMQPELARAIAQRLGVPEGQVLAFGDDRRPPPGQNSVPDRFQNPRDLPMGEFMVAERRRGGLWLTLREGSDPALSRWQRVTAATIAGVALASLLLAWLAARRITGPIERLAAAARSSRAGAPLDFIVPDGPPEVAEAARALRDFTRRNREVAEWRQAMLVAMAHDIGTPLARLAFRHEQLPDPVREAAMHDIDTIRRLLSDSLLLARGWAGRFEWVDLAALCRSIASREADTGRAVTAQADGAILLKGNALSLERMVQNLVDNAVRYGEAAEVALVSDAAGITLTVADHGPGFPDMPQAELLKPFVRGEASRSVQTGGSGLGLAIAAQVVAQHGGVIALGRGAEGGGLVTVVLPAGA